MMGPNWFCGTPECGSNNKSLDRERPRVSKGAEKKITVLFALRTADDEDHGRVRDPDGSSATSRDDKDGRNVTQM